jgi:hypothetical protein
MRRLIINEINRLNDKHNKLEYDIDLMNNPEVFSDTYLLHLYEAFVRYDADMDFKDYLLNKKG